MRNEGVQCRLGIIVPRLRARTTGKSDHQAECAPFKSEADRVVARIYVDQLSLHRSRFRPFDSATTLEAKGTTVDPLVAIIHTRWSNGHWNKPCVPS